MALIPPNHITMNLELEKFRGMISYAWETGKCVIECPKGPGAARRLRAQLYKLRDKLTLPQEIELAAQLSFKLNGCRVEIVKPQLLESTVEEQSHATPSHEPQSTPSGGLDDNQ